MNVILEVLNALASMATIAEFLLDRWREYRHQRMTEGEKEKTGGNRSFQSLAPCAARRCNLYRASLVPPSFYPNQTARTARSLRGLRPSVR